jgi:hypothetical protein
VVAGHLPAGTTVIITRNGYKYVAIRIYDISVQITGKHDWRSETLSRGGTAASTCAVGKVRKEIHHFSGGGSAVTSIPEEHPMTAYTITYSIIVVSGKVS